MQIFDDKKKRIATLSGFKDRAITTTLNSGDKELTFDYPASGAFAEFLKEEYYIRTKTDEFVIKAVEKGDRFNKYTAVLNVEELEGMAFPYGFESNEQTITACLEFAFEGTGWHVGICTVTKKRTIDEQESVTAWDILQKCLTTYRCECNINTLSKRVDIYEKIGSDRGCYFMEGLNLRRISLKSDTYDFYTRIYPIGKDGITPEWLIGKDYIDNFQYSSKIKAYVWKDERYTNTTSLIEDATAKIEEMSRPYKAYEAEVVDLAKASEEYKDILSYGIGDTVTLVSKKTRTKEKQRIVKITEYPESPEKNTVEISNARKTFAEIQKEETAVATGEAISISNRATKKILEKYSTTEDIETKITASKEAVELGVMHTLESYYDITETDAIIKATKSEIELSVSETYQTKSEMEEYSTTQETKSLIDIAVDGVEISVSEILTNYYTTEEVEAKFNVTAEQISSKVSKGDISSLISQESGKIEISADRFKLDSTNCKISEDGSIEAKNAKITGGSMCVTTDSGTKAIVSIETSVYKTDIYASGMILTNKVSKDEARFGQEGIKYWKYTGVNSNGAQTYAIDSYFDTLNGVLRAPHTGSRSYIYSLLCQNLEVYGSKSRVAETKDFGKILEYCYEMPCPVFGDIGRAKVAEDGKCYIYIDEAFSQTIADSNKYHVFLQKEGEGDIWVDEKHPDYFIVKGTSGLNFSWEIKAKQKGYENTRQEDAEEITIDKDTDYELIWYEELENYEKEVTSYEY